MDEDDSVLDGSVNDSSLPEAPEAGTTTPKPEENKMAQVHSVNFLISKEGKNYEF